MKAPILRRAVAVDAAAVRDLTRMAYANWVPLIGREPKPVTADHGLAVRTNIVDLYEEDGELVHMRKRVA